MNSGANTPPLTTPKIDQNQNGAERANMPGISMSKDDADNGAAGNPLDCPPCEELDDAPDPHGARAAERQ